MNAPITTFSLVLFACFSAMGTTSYAQVPNGGFEDWTDHGNYTEPTGWLTYNEVPTPGGPTVEAGTPGHPGSFHAVITTRQSTGGIMAIQGWISAGTSSAHAGFPFGQRPGSLTGQWQYAIQPADTGQVLVAFTKWNGSAADVIGQGSLEVVGGNGGWQAFSVPITWNSGQSPDTAYIQVVSSIHFGSPVIGSTVKVDDLAFSGTAGIAEPVGTAKPFVQIRPAGDQLHILASEPGTLQFFDASGRTVARCPVRSVRCIIDVPGLPRGFLGYRFTSNGGQQLATGKWVRE